MVPPPKKSATIRVNMNGQLRLPFNLSEDRLKGKDKSCLKLRITFTF